MLNPNYRFSSACSPATRHSHSLAVRPFDRGIRKAALAGPVGVACGSALRLLGESRIRSEKVCGESEHRDRPDGGSAARDPVEELGEAPSAQQQSGKAATDGRLVPKVGIRQGWLTRHGALPPASTRLRSIARLAPLPLARMRHIDAPAESAANGVLPVPVVAQPLIALSVQPSLPIRVSSQYENSNALRSF